MTKDKFSEHRHLTPDLDEVRRALTLVVEPGALFELRTFGVGYRGKWTQKLFGFFDDIDVAVDCVGELQIFNDSIKGGVFYTPNVLGEGLAYRTLNKLQAAGSGLSCSDIDVERRRWLLLDLDPIRRVKGKALKGIPSSDAEHTAARRLTREVREALQGEGWPAPVIASSGNGYHLMWRWDAPNEGEHLELHKHFLIAMKERFQTEDVEIDQTVFSAAQIWKLPGTYAIKGRSTDDRPWRRAAIASAPEALECVTHEQIRAIAADVIKREAAKKKKKTPSSSSGSGTRSAFDVERWLSDHALEVKAVKDHPQGGSSNVFVLSECPFHAEHGAGATVSKNPEGMLFYSCHGNRCKGKTWRDLREMVEPEARTQRLEWEEREREKENRSRGGLTVVSGGRSVATVRAHETAPETTTAQLTIVDPEGVELDMAGLDRVRDEGLVAQAIADRLLATKNGDVKPLLWNVVEILSCDPRWRGILAFDELALTVVTQKKPPWSPAEASARTYIDGQQWSDGDDNRLRLWLQREYGFEPAQTRVREAVDLVAEKNAVHPVREWLGALPEIEEAWDDPDSLLNTWLVKFAGAKDTPYVRLIGRWWLTAAVARAHPPRKGSDGVKADNVLVLEGAQGAKKSTLLRMLVPVERWFGDSVLAIGEKDAMLSLRGKWLYELAELDGYTSRRETAVIKAFLTTLIDDYRPPYGARNIRQARQCLFAATANKAEYFLDETGNRRFWPVKVGASEGAIKVKALVGVREVLWRQALDAYRDDRRETIGDAEVQVGRWWPEGREERALLAKQQQQRVVADAWEEATLKWLRDRLSGWWVWDEAKLKSEMPSVDLILRKAIGLEVAKFTAGQRSRVIKMMSALGFEHVRRRRNKMAPSRWFWPENMEILEGVCPRSGTDVADEEFSWP